MSQQIDRSGKKVPELRKECSERGIRTAGRKDELIQRLADYDRNQDFRGPAVLIPEADIMPEWPPATSFRTIISADLAQMPQVRYKCYHSVIRENARQCKLR